MGYKLFAAVICAVLTIIAAQNCEQDTDCGSGHVCFEGKCEGIGYRKACWSAKDCPEGKTCYFFYCKEKYVSPWGYQASGWESLTDADDTSLLI